jgi:hypothetical protein
MSIHPEVAAIPAQIEGTVTSLRPMRSSSSVRVVLNRRITVIAPMGASEFFAGLRVRVTGEWRRGARRRYLLASALHPLEALTDLGPERLAPVLLGVPEPTGEQVEVLRLLQPALTWLLSSGSRALAERLAHLSMRKAVRIAGNPYALVRRRDLDFEAADMLHRRLHGDPWMLPRLQAGTTEVLRRAERSGCARLTREELIARVSTLLGLSSDVEVEWELVWRSSIVARDGERYCLPSWFHQRRLALQALQNNQVPLPCGVVEGCEGLLQHRYVVLTGAAMSGKTTRLREVAAACRAAGWRVAVTAMTGKAASVIGPEAQTLHRLIGFGPRGCSKTPVPYDVVIIDEVSMLTWPMLSAALRIIPGHIIFCGDPRQLPPVEGEPVFQELLSLLPVHDLGVRPTVDVTMVRHWSTEHLLFNLQQLCQTCAREGQEWQVLSPVKSSRLGTVQLNAYLQRVMNPSGSPVGEGFRVRDRVIVVRTDYDGPVPVYNGQMGTVVGGVGTGVQVRLETGLLATVAPRDLQLAYCLTVHKVQGSRFDTVVFVVPSAAKEFAEEAHMQYVGLTRGRQATWCYAL